LKISVLLYSPGGEYKLNTSNLTNQLVGFVIFACAKILNYDIKMFHFAIAFEGDKKYFIAKYLKQSRT
jgi:hypothetical protein